MNECFSAFFSSKHEENTILHCLDKDGQYGYIAMINEFPIGDYEVYSYVGVVGGQGGHEWPSARGRVVFDPSGEGEE